MDYKELDDKVFAVVEEHGTEVFTSGLKSEYSYTLRAMAMFCGKANSLKTGMFDAIENNNPYAFRVLYRVFAEHYLKFIYLWVRMSLEKTDAVGKEYYSYCGAVEALDYMSALKMAESLLGNEVTANFMEAIGEMYPDAAKLSRKELEEQSGKFKYRTILRFLAGEKVGFVSRKQPFLSAIVPAYALYSSFVHGGPYTDLEMFEYENPKTLESCESDMEVVVMMNSTMFMLTSMAVTFAKGEKVDHIGDKVNSLLRRFSGKS